MLEIVLGDRYKIIELVGVGGMALVYKAEDLILKRLVAVKVLKEQFVKDEEFSNQFELEAQSAASLSHPNIVNVYDVGSEDQGDKRYHYIVMEYINGKTLKDHIVEKGHLSNLELIEYSKQIAAALEAAHKKNIVHRDIKPQNIMITDEGIVKVTDFGIARISTSATITYTSSILGTVHYISPEQAKGKYIDNKSDLYSLGIVMYEMSTGEVPFDAENSVGIALKHIQDRVVPPRIHNPELTLRINDIILKCLEKNPADRFQSATALMRAFRAKDLFDQSEAAPRVGPMRKQRANQPEKRNVAVYKSAESEPNAEAANRSRGTFRTKVLPILLALILVTTGFFVIMNLRENVFFRKTTVPNVTERSEPDALFMITDAGLKYSIDRRTHDTIARGYIISQTPSAGTKLKENAIVSIVISEGIQEKEMPKYTGMTREEALNAAQTDGLTIDAEEMQHSDTVEAGRVIGQYPEAGEMINSKTKISLTISLGKEETYILMPELLGSAEGTALRAIVDAGLVVGEVERQYSSEYPEGTVMWQSYDPEAQLKPNTSVSLVISRGEQKQEAPVEQLPPNTTDLTAADGDNNLAKSVYQFQIEPPTDGETFVVRITKVTAEGSELEVYNREHEVGGGSFTLNFKDYAQSHYKIYYDGELVKEL